MRYSKSITKDTTAMKQYSVMPKSRLVIAPNSKPILFSIYCDSTILNDGSRELLGSLSNIKMQLERTDWVK